MRYLFVWFVFLISGFFIASYAAPTPPDKILKIYKWTYLEEEWEWEITLPLSVIEGYRHKNRPAWQDDFTYFNKFVEPQDKAVFIMQIGLKQALKELIEEYKWSEEEQIMYVVSMIQYIPYERDEVKGAEDYVQYPAETIADGSGDCEDKAILAVALLKKLGYDSKLIYIQNQSSELAHLGIGVNFSQQREDGQYWESNGKKYYYIETTYPDFEVGELAEEWQEGEGFVID